MILVAAPASDSLVRARNTPDCSRSNPTDSYTRNSSRCFNNQRCLAEQYNYSSVTRTAVNWNHLDNTTVHADSELFPNSHCSQEGPINHCAFPPSTPPTPPHPRPPPHPPPPTPLCLCQIPGCCNVLNRYRYSFTQSLIRRPLSGCIGPSF